MCRQQKVGSVGLKCVTGLGWIFGREGGVIYLLVVQTGAVMLGGSGRSRCKLVSCQSEMAGTSHKHGCLLGCPPLGAVPMITLI